MLHDLLSVTGIWFPHLDPNDALMMQDDSRQNCPIKELPLSLYDIMPTPLALFVKSQCEQEPEIKFNNV